MIIVILQALAVLLQVVAALLALWLIPLTGKRAAWVLVSLALALAVVRRIIPFINLIESDLAALPNFGRLLFESLLLLAISTIFVIGIALIRPVFLSMKRTEDELRENQRLIKQIADTTPIHIYIIDILDRQIDYMSSRAESFFGKSSEEAHAMGTAFFLEMLHPDDLPLFAQINERFADLQDGEIIQSEYQMKQGDGQWRWLRTRSAVFSSMAEGVPRQIIGTAEDVTDHKLAEQKERERQQHMRDFYRRTILAATEGKLVICSREEICQLAAQPTATFDVLRGEDLAVIRRAVAEMARTAGMDESRVKDFVLCAGEAATNALKHAGGGTLSLYKLEDAFVFVAADKGPGIEALALPEVALKRGYTTAGSLGMGYKAMISLADTVYLATGPEGTTVAAEMKLQPVEVYPNLAALPDTW